MLGSPSAAIKPPYLALQSHPIDVELVDSYLRTWVETGVKTGEFIHDADVYAADPADLTRQFAPTMANNGERAWYFYTWVRHKSVHGQRMTRTVGNGGSRCWHGEGKPKPVYMVSNGKQHQIGGRRSLSFVNKDTGVKVRTGWLMVELSLFKNGAGKKPEAAEEGAHGYRALCKVYRSPRNPEPSGSGGTAASPGHKVEAEDDESSDATLDDDESSDATVDDDYDSYNASLPAASEPKRRFDDVESSEATVAAPSLHSKANDKISGGAAAGPVRTEKAEVDEDSAETSAAASPRKRKALDDESSGAAAPARKKKTDGSSYPVPTTEMQCPQCGTHLVLTLKRAEPKSETEPIAKDESAPGASLAAQRSETQTRGSSEKNVRFHQFF